MSCVRRIVFLLFLSVGVSISYAQTQLKQTGELGFGGGTLNYVGDLNPKFNFKFLQPAFNVFYRSNIRREFLTLRTSLTFGSLSADETKSSDPFLQARGHSFNTAVTELSMTLEYNFFDFRSEKELKIRRIHSPYLYWGLGINALSAQSTGPSTSSNGIGGVMTYGVGIKMKISHLWNVGGDFGIRHTYADHLDGYTDADINNTSSTNDVYFFTGIYLSYTILGEICPEVSKGSLNKK